jgi:hypothetical protein
MGIYSAVDPTKSKMEGGESESSTNHSVSMPKRMNGKFWLVRAKLMFRLETLSREKAASLAERVFIHMSPLPINPSLTLKFGMGVGRAYPGARRRIAAPS